MRRSEYLTIQIAILSSSYTNEHPILHSLTAQCRLRTKRTHWWCPGELRNLTPVGVLRLGGEKSEFPLGENSFSTLYSRSSVHWIALCASPISSAFMFFLCSTTETGVSLMHNPLFRHCWWIQECLGMFSLWNPPSELNTQWDRCLCLRHVKTRSCVSDYGLLGIGQGLLRMKSGCQDTSRFSLSCWTCFPSYYC